GRDLVVPGLEGNAELVTLGLDVVHEREDAGPNRAEVVVLHLLALRGLRAEERAARRDEVGALQVEVPVDQEVLLLGADRRVDAVDLLAEDLEEADRPRPQRA